MTNYTCRDISLELSKIDAYEEQIKENSGFNGRSALGILGDFGRRQRDGKERGREECNRATAPASGAFIPEELRFELSAVWHDIMQGFSRLGAHLALTALALGIMFAACWAGYQTHQVTRSRIAGWIVGIVSGLICILLFGGVMDILTKAKCAGVDQYESCVDGD